MKNRGRTSVVPKLMYGALPQSMSCTWRDQSRIGKHDDDFAFPETIMIERLPARDNEILGLNIPMKD